MTAPAQSKSFARHWPLALFLTLQLTFWAKTRDIMPSMDIVPDVPGRESVKALSFGDEQFYFRMLALELQNAGDTYGRFTALKLYDYNKLSHWFTLLDELDNQSDLVPSMAAYYYSQTQYTPDVRYVIDYLYRHAADRPEQKWWWLVQAVYLANHKLNDKDLALKVAQPLTRAQSIPIWAQQMPAFIHEQRGEMEEALAIMEGIKANLKNIPQGELNFMKYFIEERLHALDSKMEQGR